MDESQFKEPKALEGIVERGQIRLKGNVRLPERTEVLVLVLDQDVGGRARAVTPHLVERNQAADFRLEMVETHPDAGV